MSIDNKVTFVLPLSSSRDIDLAINILLPSMMYFFDLSDLYQFIIILNEKDFELFYLMINKYNYINDLMIKVINEKDLYDNNVTNTYYLQMLLKLLIFKYVDTTNYITLDADNIFIKKCNASNFYDDKCFYQKVNKKDKWMKRVTSNIDVNFEHNINQTPFVFVKYLVEKLCNDLNVNELILNKNCSEYTLYLGYFKKIDLFDYYYKEYNYNGNIINNDIVNNIMEDIEIRMSENFFVNDNKVICTVQSRLNKINELIDIIKDNIPTITFNKLKISMLTVISNDKYFKRYEDALFIKKDYCKYHNYDFNIKLLDSCDGWDKLKQLKLLLEQNKYDYIFLSDADVVMTNRDKRIEDIIIKYQDDNTFMFISEDYNSLNSGNIIFKNCEESVSFLNKVFEVGIDKIRYSLNEPYKSIGIYEQPSIIHIINKEYDYYKDKIKIIPQNEINSYLPLLNINKGKWKKGDLLLHFAGFNYKENEELRNKINLDMLIKRFTTIYKILIIQKEGNDYGNIR